MLYSAGYDRAMYEPNYFNCRVIGWIAMFCYLLLLKSEFKISIILLQVLLGMAVMGMDEFALLCMTRMCLIHKNFCIIFLLEL